MQTVEHWRDKIDLPGLLLGLGEDLEREGLQETPNRVHHAWEEMLRGYSMDPEEILAKTFELDRDLQSGIQITKGIHFTSICEHHLIPFFGTIKIAYEAKERVVGLSKLARLAECYACRLQLQERLTNQILDDIVSQLQPLSAMVVIDGMHLCCVGRGVRQKDMHFVTSNYWGEISPMMLHLLALDN